MRVERHNDKSTAPASSRLYPRSTPTDWHGIVPASPARVRACQQKHLHSENLRFGDSVKIKQLTFLVWKHADVLRSSPFVDPRPERIMAVVV